MQELPTANYFERRAEEERVAAQRATNDRAARSHRELAEHYGKLASGAEQSPDEEIEPESGALPRDFQIVP